jgi:hypothetical protein
MEPRMHHHYLTKSDFKVARTCPTKLYYRKKGYPTVDDGNEFLAALADQGYLIEALARTFYPDGRWVGYRANVEEAAWETMAALTDNCTLFEATFISGGKMARADILARRGDVIELIEIKSCGFDRQQYEAQLAGGQPNLFRAARQPAEIQREWRPYLEDAAFQTAVLQELFPQLRVIPYLLMPDTSQPCHIDGLHHRFVLRSHGNGAGDLASLAADYADDPRDIRRNPFLARVNVEEEVHLLLPEVRRQVEGFLASLRPALTRVVTPPSINCQACEYRVTEGELRGFHDCWGALADVKPHILDLYHVQDVGGRKEPLANRLIAQGKVGLFDIPERELARRDGQVGEQASRQLRQIAYTRANREWVDEGLGAALDALVFPLYFVDFETCAPAVPRYRGMRPFESIAFQWSCHYFDNPGAAPQHSEWLQTADTFPNAAFAASLRRRLGDAGSILVWSTHEATILRAIRRQLIERGEGDSEIVAWIGDTLENGRIVDLHRVAARHYFHPRMGGRTSLKVVADAVWQSNPAIRARLPQYLLATEEGQASPYQALPPLTIAGRQIAVAEGAGAILAYYAMMERLAANATLEANQWRQLLKQYCGLDTMAMVMVWWHWLALTGRQ